MERDQEVNGIAQKVALIAEIGELIRAGNACYDELYGVLGKLTFALEMLDARLDTIANTVNAIRRKDCTVNWEGLGEFQGTPAVCDIWISKAVEHCGHLRNLVCANKVPADSIPLIRRIVWIEDSVAQ